MGLLLTSFVYGGLVFVNIGQMLAQLYFIIMFSDLESDYVNPMELCESMDWMAPTEAVIQAAVTASLLFIGDLRSMLIVAPCTAWNAWQYRKTGLKYDATEIFKTVRGHRIEALIKFAFYFLLFCYFLYCMIWALVVYSEA